MAVAMAKMQKRVARYVNPGFEKLCMEHSLQEFVGLGPGPYGLFAD
jgi:hypothetical protein